MADPAKRVERRSRRSIFHAYLEAARKAGGDKQAITDGDGRKLAYKDITRAAFGLSGPIARMTAKGETLAVLLPTGAGAVISIFALHAAGRVPAMLNFTAGVKNLKSACKAAQVTKVLTAHKFIEIANLSDVVDALSDSVQFIYLEDLREQIKPLDKVRAILGPMVPSVFAAKPNPDDAGVILFTSGTEGAPKGVVLSHANILANIEQITLHVHLAPTDIFFNPLPVFHCYGLTAGSLWPLMRGYPVVFHPSPLQTKIVAQRIFETSSTVLFATDTFLQQYMRASADGGMSSLRIAVCGAERVRDETRQAAERRFSFEVLEGYGVTECSPVLAANQPGDIRAGTIGKMLPAIEYRVDPVEGLEGAGRLVVRGPNVMRGYILEDAPGVLKPLADGWHDTGDVVSIDKEGYITIRGRMKRFAKIGGEMVSLTVVENCASAVWPDNNHAAAILPDKRKGEQVVLVTDRENADRSALLTWAQTHGVPEIAVPKKIVFTDELPVLGTGKLDYVSVTKRAKEALEERAAARDQDAAAEGGKKDKKALKEKKKKQDSERRAEAKRLAKEAKQRAKDAKTADQAETSERAEAAASPEADPAPSGDETTSDSHAPRMTAPDAGDQPVSSANPGPQRDDPEALKKAAE
ncbi:MAG: AMP-binding protein [Pseudomonadota bacterium]